MFENKVALVTGAARGIGKEIALTLAERGAFVIVNYNGSKEKAEEVVSLILEKGGQASAYQCNVADYKATEEMMKEMIARHKHIDILVNNAGITKDNLIVKMSEEDFDKVMETNLKGVFNTIRHSARQMLKQRSGKIINISSVSGVLGNVGQANYAASKAGIIGLTKSMARELASRHINVNAVAPGFITTDMSEALSESVKELTLAQIPFKKYGETKDIAEIVAFLASDSASYITGQVINVDGGMAI